MILENKSVLITGGTGSLGKILVRRILSGELGHPRRVTVLSRDEAKQHAMRVHYLNRKVTTDEVIYSNFQRALSFRIGDVRNYADVCAALRDADIVFNAAALKQVPICEYFPEQALLTNCLGPANIVRALKEHAYPVQAVIGVSTDKACKPVNVMGMTKALQERIFTSANVEVPHTRFVCVRYGNVLASRGSVVPLFHDQIASGGPVTVTVPEMTRFLLTLNQAVDTVFAALQGGFPGETYIPRAPAATVMNIATALVGERDIAIKITGIRPGEKMDEILISEEECHRTVLRGGFFCILPILPELHNKEAAFGKGSTLVKEYSSADEVLDLPETTDLLKRHRLMPGEAVLVEGNELLA
jgi:FlaA1/EpsC-like NDP-sugar epimerase